jgi:hypothetical protein
LLLGLMSSLSTFEGKQSQELTLSPYSCLQRELLQVLAAEGQELQKMHVALAKQLKALKVPDAPHWKGVNSLTAHH